MNEVMAVISPQELRLVVRSRQMLVKGVDKETADAKIQDISS